VVARSASRSPIELVPYERAYEEGFEDMQRRVPDLSKLRALTGYEPRVQLDEIIDRVVAYFTSDATRR
jgi:UDP-glucose 4-epimerase